MLGWPPASLRKEDTSVGQAEVETKIAIVTANVCVYNMNTLYYKNSQAKKEAETHGQRANVSKN